MRMLIESLPAKPYNDINGARARTHTDYWSPSLLLTINNILPLCSAQTYLRVFPVLRFLERR